MSEPVTETAPVLQMRGISKTFPGVRALDHVSLEVRPGEVHALMGENGAGKSTLMKVLAGAYQPDGGEIILNGQPARLETPQKAMALGVGIIYQEFNLVPQLSVAENIFLGREPRGALPGFVNAAKMQADARQIMESLGARVDVRKPVGTLPVAQQQMVEIAKATSRQSRIIAMDEPSATLTEHELENLWRLIRQLKAEGVSIIYISHRMEEVFAIADRVTVLRDGRTVGTRDIGDVTQAQLIQMMVGRPLEDTFPKEAAPRGAPLLEVRGLTRRGVLEDISFTVHAGEIVALAGLVGAGRTEIARCIFGADRFDAGEIRLNGKPLTLHSPRDAIRAGIGMVTEDRKGQGLVLDLSVRENTSLAALPALASAGFIQRGRERAVAQDYVKNLGTRTPSIEQRVKNLSGGNQQKVVLSKWLLTHSKLLIMDEPTRGIDVGAKAEIYRLMNRLTAEGIGILMISSELPEVLGMADRIIVVREGRIVGEMSRAEATQEKIGHLVLGTEGASQSAPGTGMAGG
ncbi:MAG: sugar ABC transporter ATP-binding protein [Armatimonadetes bacterium]|nr:sugar ABC transporter ATP-binding protein [Armatimonadota bacterium]